MDFRQEYYSLEFHLENAAKYNTQFEILNAIWKLNKKNLSSALDNVAQYFPHFSLHEKSHSNTIISNIESFLGEERIRRLSPTDTWLLLMATYTHDLGMVVFYELVEKQWGSVEFQNVISELQQSNDPEIKESAIILSDLQGLNSENFAKADLSPIKIKNAVTLVVSEYIRRKHHVRSSEILKGSDEMFSNLSSSFYSDQIPQRLLDILGEVAYLHGVNFYETIDRLDYQANGIANDKIHPRFISAMLRLGDLLDIDDGRFNAYTEKVFKFPATSSYHKQKHSSIKHFLITPETIEITADCNNENSYRLARSWFDWLNEEVELQSKEWSNISPRDLGGGSPKIPKGKIKVYYKNNTVKDDLLNIQFKVSNERIFGILEGSSIYEDAEFTFLRELVQNAIDASKIQLWRKIADGTYNSILKRHKQTLPNSTEGILKAIKFREDIPRELLYSLPVNLTFNWVSKDDCEERILQIIVEDEGTGISDNDLIRMTNKVGESRKIEKGYKEFVESMPNWLKPTGAFGVGLQSVFLIVESFIVQTKTENSVAREIIFRSSKNGKYSSITDKVPEMSRGTKVIIELKESSLPEIFGDSMPSEAVDNFDYFEDEYGSLYVHKIKLYVNNTLKDIPGLRISFYDNIIQDIDLGTNDYVISPKKLSDDGLISAEIQNYNDGYLTFGFDELLIGSEFFFMFPLSLEDIAKDMYHQYRLELYVRDIKIDTKTTYYYKLRYCKLRWNLLSPESDKILSLNRENLLKKPKRVLEETFLSDVVPDAISLTETLFLEEYAASLQGKFKPAELASVYFSILLLKSINNLDVKNLNETILGDYNFPEELVSGTSDEKIKLKEFFNIETFLIPPRIYTQSGKKSRTETKKVVSELINAQDNSLQSRATVLWEGDFFSRYLLNHFCVIKVVTNPKGDLLVIEKSSNKFESIEFEREEDYLKSIIRSLHRRYRRDFYYSFSKYANTLSVINHYETGFEYFPSYSRTSIISPFAKREVFFNLYEKVKPILEKSDSLAEFLTIEMIKSLVGVALINYISKNSQFGVERPKEEDIILGYRQLITDLLVYYHLNKTELDNSNQVF